MNLNEYLVNYNIKEVDHEQSSIIIETREPRGLYYTYDGNVIVGIDNTGGDAWVEEFSELEECIKWLIGEEAVDRYGVKLDY